MGRFTQIVLGGILLALISGGAPAWGQDPGASAAGSPAQQEAAKAPLRGFIRTIDGAALPGALVRIANIETSQAWVSWSDESGKFEFPPLPPGSYRVQASELGFAETSQILELPEASARPVALTLRVATLAELSAPGEPATAKPAIAGNQPNHPAPGKENNAPPNSPNSVAANAGRPGENAAGRSAQRGQVPAGVTNAIRQGMGGGFQQTDLTGESNATGEENAAQQNGGAQASGALSPSIGGSSASTSDSFLLQGTIGQATSAGGPGGPGGFGGMRVGPGGPGGPGGLGGGFGGGGPGAPNAGGFGGGQRFAGGGGGGPVLFSGSGGPGGGGRFLRQAVNRIRWGFYDRYENSIWDAKPYSITGAESPKISHYDERVGANVGGPFSIPHLYNGKDRTFFFLNYQHETQETPVDAFSTVPTLDERSGLFCGGATLFDPSSNGFQTAPRTAFPVVNGCQQIPINIAAQGLLAFIPKPNEPGTVQNFQLQTTTPLNSDFVNFHFLHTVNSKFNFSAAYNFNSQRINTQSNFPGIGGNQSTRNQNLDLGVSHNWTPHLVEDTHLNWSRSRIKLLSDNSFGADIAAELGITGVSNDPINFGIPLINFTSVSGISDPVPSLVRNQTWRFSDAFTYVHQKHTVKFGGELRRIELNTTSDPIARGQFVFTGLMTSQLDPTGAPVPGTGNDFADFLLGLPYQTQARFGDPNTYFRNWGFIGYGQDEWRVTPHFTFQFGLRYEGVTPPVEINNQIANLDVNATATAVAVVTPGGTGPFSGVFPRALVHGDYSNWEPRIGFAWQPALKRKTIVRAGYSIFYNESIYDTLVQSLAYQPPFATAQTRLTSSSAVLTLDNGFPAASGPGTGPSILNTAAISPFYKNGYAQLWMLSTETDLSPNWILTFTYTGTKGTDLDLLRAPNRAPLGTPPTETDVLRRIPDATGFTFDQSGANSLYNALQVRLVHRFTKGLMLQGIYTFSKALDNASTIGGASPVVVQQDGNFAAEWGLSPFDIRHQLRVFSVYELPFGERQRWATEGWKKKLLEDWRVMNSITWRTGTPFTALLGGTASDNGTGANLSLRAEQIGDPNAGICGGSSLAFFDTAAFTTPPLDANGNPTYGNERRGAIEGPCSFSWNFSVARDFRFGPDRAHRMSVRWEAQNLTNTPSFTSIADIFGSTSFGRVTAAGSMRTMDVMVRFNF